MKEFETHDFGSTYTVMQRKQIKDEVVARTIDGFRQPDFVVISPGVEAIVFESFGQGFSVIFVV